LFLSVQNTFREAFISAANANEMIAKQLKTAPGAPVLSIEIKLSCQNGEAVEHRLTYVHLGLLKFYSRARDNPSFRNLPQR